MTSKLEVNPESHMGAGGRCIVGKLIIKGYRGYSLEWFVCESVSEMNIPEGLGHW